MPLLIYKKFFVSGSDSKIFINKVDFGQIGYLVKILQFCPLKEFFATKHLPLSKKFTMLRGFEIGATTWILDFTSKMGPGVGLPHPQGVTPDQKYWAWSTYPMGGSNHPSFVKIGDIDFRQVFVSCVEILLKENHSMT